MWKPITRNEFEELYRQKEQELSSEERQVFERFKVPIETALIRRSASAGVEAVFVVARCPGGVLYFDDVEYGFNVSPIDERNSITQPGGSQFTLSEAVSC